jgi:hypothetical protein
MPPGCALERTIGQVAQGASASHDRCTRGRTERPFGRTTDRHAGGRVAVPIGGSACVPGEPGHLPGCCSSPWRELAATRLAGDCSRGWSARRELSAHRWGRPGRFCRTASAYTRLSVPRQATRTPAARGGAASSPTQVLLGGSAHDRRLAGRPPPRCCLASSTNGLRRDGLGAYTLMKLSRSVLKVSL